MVRLRLSYLQAGIIKHKSYCLRKLIRSSAFRLCLIEKNKWLGANG